MNSKEKWNIFYNKVGGKYICSECGNILTESQYKAINETSCRNWALIIILSILLTPLFAIIHLLFFGVKKKCPICKAELDKILSLNSKEGMKIFKDKHSKLANLLEGLSPIKD